ncbi:MAG TPA: SPFH domain-containing protein [Steroidobacteraceae bacterium]|nr:SPFH domain-containing protein [Steroidobacteraceae bacterium]
MNYPEPSHEPTEERNREHPTSGWVGLLLALAFAGGGLLLVARGEFPAVPAIALGVLLLKGLFTLEPNQAAVLVFFGEYAGTVRRDGFFFVNPLYARRKLSLRVRNFATPTLKVNDQRGNPIEIAAVITWYVHDTAQAVFDVDSFESYTQIQSEMALREVAGSHPYESQAPGEVSLRSHFADISKLLTAMLRQHLAVAGVEVDDARITHLAYAPEIAHVMLRRQQAEAVVHARERMVEGALGMISGALARMESDHIGALAPPERATLVINMMTVLLSESPAQPVIQLSDSRPHG